MGRKYHPKLYLEKCKYVVKKNKMTNVTGTGLPLHSFDDSDGFDSERYDWL